MHTRRLVDGINGCGETQKASTLSKADYWGPTLQLEKVACAKEEMFEGLNIGLLCEQECISPKMCNLFTLCILCILPMDFVGLDSKDPTQCIQACYLHQIQWLHRTQSWRQHVAKSLAGGYLSWVYLSCLWSYLAFKVLQAP